MNKKKEKEMEFRVVPVKAIKWNIISTLAIFVLFLASYLYVGFYPVSHMNKEEQAFFLKLFFNHPAFVIVTALMIYFLFEFGREMTELIDAIELKMRNKKIEKLTKKMEMEEEGQK